MLKTLLHQLKQRDMLPRISDTERAALEAGTTWIEADLFSGRPDFRRILEEPYPDLTEEERAFVDGPLEALLALADRLDLRHARVVPAEVMEFLQRERFFGLRIAREHGGHGFGALACSVVYGKLAVRSMVLYSLVLIPNSVGPGELIEHYGTPEQKGAMLPRLASGEEIPCFALTEPTAGSDAASITSHGVVFRADDGAPAIRLNWNKRYITLAPICTLLGLAFRLRDPENLLGQGKDVGITFALVPTHLPGVETGRYHDPLVPFANGPTRGRDVVVPVSAIIGGAGRGWIMLMEALAGGRAVSLPAQSAAGARALARVTGAYSVAREQFGLSIGRFEGIEEPLARIGGLTYLMDAARVFTCAAVDRGSKPSVASAMAKYNLTELVRQVTIDSMDVFGGKGICRGPGNPVADAWMAAPIGITVEGANILTRTLIVFGQGLVRCHPYMRAEIEALEKNDSEAFGRALGGHLRHFAGNVLRAKLHFFTRGWFAATPIQGPTARYFQKLAWASATFASLADAAAMGFGANLKRKGRLAGRFADALSWMFMGTAVLRRFEAEGRPKELLPLVHWSAQYALWRVQVAFEGILENFDAPVVGPLFKINAAFMRLNPVGRPPSDRLGSKVAEILRTPGPARDALTRDLPGPAASNDIATRLDRALVLLSKAAPLHGKIRKAIGSKRLTPTSDLLALTAAAVEAGVLTADEAATLHDAEAARADVISVDEFSADEYLGMMASTGVGVPGH